MKLLIDIGNSRIKWALLEEGVASGYGQCLHKELVAELGRIQSEDVDAIYVSSVAAQSVEQELFHYLEQRWAKEVTVLQTGTECCGVSNGYQRPEQLGVDRWAAMIAARRQFAGSLCVVDCGSAVTVDAVDASGRHLGGYIIPGLTMQQQMLRQGTAAVNVSRSGTVSSGWGRNTGDCVAHGAMEAISGLIDRSRSELGQLCNGNVVTIVTGGDAAVILPLLESPVHYEEHLVLRGMAHMVGELEG